MKDSQIPSDDALIEWAGILITDLGWIEAFDARRDRNYRWFENIEGQKQMREPEPDERA